MSAFGMQEEELENLHSHKNTEIRTTNMKERKKQEAPALVEFIFFTKIGPMGNARLRTRVFTMKHEIL